jgi:hypothetical protein
MVITQNCEMGATLVSFNMLPFNYVQQYRFKENGDLLADSYKIWIGGRMTFISYRIYMGLTMLGRLKNIQLSL